jgi:putative phage-type endonuclease
MYFRYSEHYLQSEIDAFEQIAAEVEQSYMAANQGQKPDMETLALHFYMRAAGATIQEAQMTRMLQADVLYDYYGSANEDEITDAFVLAATAYLIVKGTVPYASGKRTYRADYHPIALVECAGMPESTWLEWRRQSLGGSDCGAIFGVAPWNNNYSIYNDKIGVAPIRDKSSQRIFDYGHLAEEIIAKSFQEEHDCVVWNDTVMYRHPYYPWIAANMDRRLLFRNGMKAILEIKTASWKKRDEWLLAPPIYYQYQCRQYMAVMNVNTTFITCMTDRDEKDITHRIDREAQTELYITDGLTDFWLNHVLVRVPPMPNGSDATRARVSDRYRPLADPNRPEMLLSDRTFRPMLDRYFDLKKQEAALKAQLAPLSQEIETIKLAIQDEMGETCQACCDNDPASYYKVSYTPTSKVKVNHEGLKLAYPDIYRQYCTEVPEASRTLRIAVKKKPKGFVLPGGGVAAP